MKTKGQILVLDDDEPVMRALCDTLKDHAYDTSGFISPDDALEELKKRKYDIVLTDLNMPEMDGINVLREAHKIDEHLMGIIMTGEGTINTAVNAMKNGAMDYILKPFKLNTILPVLSRAITLRRLSIENLELTDHLRQRTKELELMNKDLEAFSFSVSHDLRAPVGIMQNICYMIKEEYQTKFDASFWKLFNNIQGNCQYMEGLIEDLLQFFKSGRNEIIKEQLDLNEITQEIVNNITLGDNKVKFELDVLPVVYGDRTLIYQVFTNLISNAYKYSGKVDVPLIRIGSTIKSNLNIIHIIDNGDGFDMEQADKLFEPFQRLHTEEEFKGSGIGLAIVRRIINRHGGDIWAESIKGKGASFFFSLPVASN